MSNIRQKLLVLLQSFEFVFLPAWLVSGQNVNELVFKAPKVFNLHLFG